MFVRSSYRDPPVRNAVVRGHESGVVSGFLCFMLVCLFARLFIHVDATALIHGLISVSIAITNGMKGSMCFASSSWGLRLSVG